MEAKRLTVVLGLALLVTGLALCVVLNATCGLTSCLQAILLTVVVLVTCSPPSNLDPQISVTVSAMTGPLWKPPA